MIIEILPGSPAQSAGLRRGDYILSIAGEDIDSVEELAGLIDQRQEGDEITIEIWRNGRNEQVTAGLQPKSTETRQRSADDQQSRQADDQQQAGRDDQQRNRDDAPQQERGDDQQQERRDDQQQAGRDEGRQDNRDEGSEPWIGLWLEERSQDGAIVRQVLPNGPAARAGLRAGDVIVSIDGQQVDSPEQLVDQVASHQPNERAEFTVRRGNTEQIFEVPIGRRSDLAQMQMQPGQQFGREVQFGTRGADQGMSNDQQRRFEERQQRIEQMLADLRDELRQLRQELGRSGGTRAAQRDDGKPSNGNQQQQENQQQQQRSSQGQQGQGQQDNRQDDAPPPAPQR
jgi:C-terminal processing protease CtpA/Prc